MKGLKWLGFLAGVVLLLVLASLGIRAIQERGIAGKLAKLRQKGHPTTMAELNAWYADVPAESNAAVNLLAAVEMFSTVVPDKLPIIGPNAARVEPFDAWSAEAKSLAADYVSSNVAAYAALNQTLKLPLSRYPGTFSYNGMISHLSPIKQAAQKMTLAAQSAAEQGKAEEATEGIENVFRVARTIEGEPVFISVLVRNACVAIGASATERVINRLELSDSQISRIQTQISSALATNALARGLAGELAYGLEGFSMGPAQLAQLMNPVGGGAGLPSAGSRIAHAFYAGSGLKGADQGAYLDAMIRLQEAAAEDFPRRLNTASNIAYEATGGSNSWPMVRMMTKMTIPSLAKSFDRDAQLTATLRCALTALAVERFRIAHEGKLPATLVELVPQYLADVPSDPYNGKPLLFKPLTKGFVVYSLGDDGDDDGGRPKKSGQKVAGDHDVAFRIER